MSRPIKFRAWDRLENVMRHDLELFQIPEWTEQMTSADQVSPMQFTGLLDKNGKEIYEGDILRFSVGFMSKPVCKDSVEWSVSRACWNLKERGYVLPSVYQHEVIGNVYENPEFF